MVRNTVAAFMVEKKECLDNLEEICEIPGVDMVQFGPSDYSMSLGWNAGAHVDEYKAAEREMIRIALSMGFSLAVKSIARMRRNIILIWVCVISASATS